MTDEAMEIIESIIARAGDNEELKGQLLAEKYANLNNTIRVKADDGDDIAELLATRDDIARYIAAKYLAMHGYYADQGDTYGRYRKDE